MVKKAASAKIISQKQKLSEFLSSLFRILLLKNWVNLLIIYVGIARRGRGDGRKTGTLML